MGYDDFWTQRREPRLFEAAALRMERAPGSLKGLLLVLSLALGYLMGLAYNWLREL